MPETIQEEKVRKTRQKDWWMNHSVVHDKPRKRSGGAKKERKVSVMRNSNVTSGYRTSMKSNTTVSRNRGN